MCLGIQTPMPRKKGSESRVPIEGIAMKVEVVLQTIPEDNNRTIRCQVKLGAELDQIQLEESTENFGIRALRLLTLHRIREKVQEWKGKCKIMRGWLESSKRRMNWTSYSI